MGSGDRGGGGGGREGKEDGVRVIVPYLSSHFTGPFRELRSIQFPTLINLYTFFPPIFFLLSH